MTNLFYQSVGLSANSNKSLTVGNARQLKIGDSEISSDDKLTYLCVTIDSENKHRMNRSIIAPLLAKLKRASLRPNQKLYMLRTHFIPKFSHRLSNEDTTGTILSDLDRAVRNCAKEFLHLPDAVASSWFHLSIRNGGLGLKEFRFEIPVMRYKRLAKLRFSNSWIIQDIVASNWFDVRMRKLEHLLPRYKDNQIRLLNDLEKIKTFKSQACFGVAGSLTNRHLLGNTWFSGRLFISYLRMRTCTIGASGYEPVPVYCRHHCGKIETLKHILSECKHMEGMHRKRHNLAQKIIVDHLESTGWIVFTNYSVIDGEGLEKIPDIVAVSPDKISCLVLDVQVSFESDKTTLHDRNMFKRQKYSEESVLAAIKTKLAGSGFRPVSFDLFGLIFGARGAIHNTTLNILRNLDMSISQIGSILDLVSRESLTLFRVFGLPVDPSPTA